MKLLVTRMCTASQKYQDQIIEIVDQEVRLKDASRSLFSLKIQPWYLEIKVPRIWESRRILAQELMLMFHVSVK